jgi:glucose/arabinose dehydrogenase
MLRPFYRTAAACACAFALLAGCVAESVRDPSSTAQAAPARENPDASCTTRSSGFARGTVPSTPPGLTVPSGFRIETIAAIPGARELVALGNGDLLVGTTSRQVYLVPDAEANGPVGQPLVFATLNDNEAAGVGFSASRCEIYVATTNRVWAIPYRGGDLQARSVTPIASVRTGPVAPYSDGDVHTTTSVAFDDSKHLLYVSVGSSCNSCVEVDPTRASILQMRPDGSDTRKRATRIRNAIAIAIDPETSALWAGGAGQDNLPFGHPYEFLDDVSARRTVADYGWPDCEENRVAYTAGANCSNTVVPRVELPAYSTIVGAVFYPLAPSGRFAFPKEYRGALFAATHGSWHRTSSGAFAVGPQIVSIAMRGDEPAAGVDWSSPTAQWRTFAAGFQYAGTQRRGRPTGIAVGIKGSLFAADDAAGAVYRVRPIL